MKKRICLLFLALVCLLALPLMASADTSGTCGANMTWTLDDYGVLTFTGSGMMYDSSKDWSAKFEKANVLEVKFQSGITSIAPRTFDGCSKMISVELPDTLLSIGLAAFSRCTSLTVINIPESVKSIEYGAFHEEFNGTKYNRIPAKLYVTNVNGNAAHVLGKGNYEFYHADYPRMSMRYVYDGAEVSEFEIYKGDSNITEIVWPEGIASIRTDAFRKCKDLTEAIIPDSVRKIGGGAFRECDSLTKVVIPEGIVSIGDCTFWFDTKLSSVTLPSTLDSIGAEAFYNCRTLASIEIPDNVTTIEKNAFANNSGGYISVRKIVSSLDCPATIALSKAGYDFWCQDYKQIAMRYSLDAEGEVTQLRVSAADKTATAVTVPSGVTNINESVFSKCTDLKEITLPASLKQIDKNAFNGATGLKYVYYGGSENDWATVTIAEGNDALSKAVIMYDGSKDIPVTSIELNKTTATMTRTSAKKKPTLQLKAKVGPAEAANPAVKWSSSNPKVARVDANGKVTALKAGKATITCTAKDGSGVEATCEITVKDKQISKITLIKTKVTLAKGKTFQLKVKTIKPADAFNKKVKWSSSNKKIARVDKNGKVKALKKGTCYIICTAMDGSGVQVKCKITVK